MAILPIQLARVSNLLRTNVASQQITRGQRSLLDVQNELTTGKRLSSPSDDPGDAAIAQQLRKTLEQRAAYLDNLEHATNHLSEVDVTVGDLVDLLQQAQTIASANVGSDVTAEERASAAAIIESLYSQILSIANRQFEGVYLFAGDRLTEPPFVPEAGGVRFVGSAAVLQNTYDENTVRPFMVSGDELFGALSTRITGTADLTPALSADTRLIDLRGVGGEGIAKGSIQISDGTTAAIVDLSRCDTVGDIVDAINNAGIGAVTAATSGGGLTISAGGGDDITVTEVGGGSAAYDLGILTPVSGGSGVPVVGAGIGPRVTVLTPLADLNGGAGIDLTGLRITNGLLSADITLSSPPLPTPPRVQDLLNAINGSGTAVRAEINAAGTGLNILNPTQGTQMTVGELGGTTATDLGVRSLGPDSPLTQLNLGQGVRAANGPDFRITDSSGVGFDVDVTGTGTIQDVLNAINAAAGLAGAGVTASLATTGNGIVLTDTAGGAGTLGLTPLGFSQAAADLGLTGAASGGVIQGVDVNPVKAQGIFSNVARLRAGLVSSDRREITAAAEGLREDLLRATRIRGRTGAQVLELESRRERTEDQNLASKALLSSLEDTDFTDAIARFQTIQTSLEASMQTTGRLLSLSLLDFLR
jgi:flagellar hook-associated protein 3 FlgL